MPFRQRVSRQYLFGRGYGPSLRKQALRCFEINTFEPDTQKRRQVVSNRGPAREYNPRLQMRLQKRFQKELRFLFN